jgi:hypothetical protein
MMRGSPTVACLSALLCVVWSVNAGCQLTTAETGSADAGTSIADVGPAAPEVGDTCTVGAVKDATVRRLNLSAFYKKEVDLDGFPILSSEKTQDAALCAARAVIRDMLAPRPDILARLVQRKVRLAVMAESEVTTDIPEHSDLTPKDYWDQRARGLGATRARPATSVGEENVLCLAQDRYRGESILVHEFAHTLFNMGVELDEPELGRALDDAYAKARAAGRFDNTYAAENRDEYWAEGVQSFFDTNLRVSPPNGIHGEVATRDALRAYDPDLTSLIVRVLTDSAYRYRCGPR